MPARLIKGLKNPPRKMVVLTPEQDRFVVKVSKRDKVSHSEALRRIIQKAKDDEAFQRQLLKQLAD
jgi:hypothetical protein